MVNCKVLRNRRPDQDLGVPQQVVIEEVLHVVNVKPFVIHIVLF